MSCYATLSSHVQKAEFPDNGPSDLKARLPKDRLWQEDGGWEVGLPGVSFPAIPPPPPQKVHPENILIHEDYDSIGHPDQWDNNGYLCTYYYTIVNRDGKRTCDRSERASRNLPYGSNDDHLSPFSSSSSWIVSFYSVMSRQNFRIIPAAVSKSVYRIL